MSERSKADSRRLAVFEALKVAAPSGFNEERRRTFLNSTSNIVFAELAMDSLGEMEFCIAIELSTGVTLLPAELVELGSTDAVERVIRERLGEAAESGE